MVFRTLGLGLLLISSLTYAQGRKPAVEDFVGIEIDQPEVVHHGSESLYNLEQDITRIENQKNKPAQELKAPPRSLAKNWTTSTVLIISLIFGLPLFVWLLIMSHLKKKASLESASNIEVLEKYRKEREKKSEESYKKAS